ncbi:MAG: hypothetical protein ACXVCQ_18530, partial [Bacteriovorax sp.]
MKNSFKILIPFLLISFGLIFLFGHNRKSSLETISIEQTSRFPASEAPTTCSELIKKIFTRNNIFVKGPLQYVSEKISRLNYQTRLMYLDFLGHHHFQSNKLNYKYADLINSALKKETISEEDANNLIRTLNDKGLNHIYMSDHIVYPFLIDSLATDEEITKSTLILMPQLRDRMRSELDTLEPSKRELEALGPIQNEIRSEEDLMRAISFLEYSRTYQPLEQINCLGDIQYLFSKSPNSPYLSTFEKNQSKVEKFIKKEETNKLHELVSDKNLSEEKAKEMALEWSNQRGRVYQKLLYSCQARGASLQRSATNKRFFQTVLGLELTISTGAYLVVHKDDEKNSDWYKKLTAEILLKLAVAAARSGITTMTSGEWYKKAIQDYVLGAVNDVGPTLGYSAAFSPSQKELKERLDQLFEDPLFKEKMKELEFIMKKEG